MPHRVNGRGGLDRTGLLFEKQQMRDELLFLPAREGIALRVLPETIGATALEIAIDGPGQVVIAAREGIAAKRSAVGRFVATGAHHLVPEVPLEHDRRIEAADDRHTLVAIGLTAAIAEAAATRLLPSDWYATVADAAVWAVRLGAAAKIGIEEVDTIDESVVIRDAEESLVVRCRMVGRALAAFEPTAAAVRPKRRMVEAWANEFEIGGPVDRILIVVVGEETGRARVTRRAPVRPEA